MRSEWSQFKAIIDTHSPGFFYTENDLKYDLTLQLGTQNFECILLKDAGSDVTVFETSYKSRANRPTVPEQEPFAQPVYRTKRDAAAITSVSPNNSVDIDFLITAERYIHGGCIIVENAEFGDYITAQVEDLYGIIPLAYRAALCEAHPIVSQYIVKQYIEVETPGTALAGGITTQEVDTFPLNAKIPAGLYLCITYYAVNSGLTRRIAINYYLTKKL